MPVFTGWDSVQPTWFIPGVDDFFNGVLKIYVVQVFLGNFTSLETKEMKHKMLDNKAFKENGVLLCWWWRCCHLCGLTIFNCYLTKSEEIFFVFVFFPWIEFIFRLQGGLIKVINRMRSQHFWCYDCHDC